MLWSVTCPERLRNHISFILAETSDLLFMSTRHQSQCRGSETGLWSLPRTQWPRSMFITSDCDRRSFHGDRLQSPSRKTAQGKTAQAPSLLLSLSLPKILCDYSWNLGLKKGRIGLCFVNFPLEVFFRSRKNSQRIVYAKRI